MNCNVIQDLLPLYADGCCSDESKALIEEHLCSCERCKTACREIRSELAAQITPTATPKPQFRRIHEWKASVLQAVLLFFSFALLTFGVAKEAATPSGDTNGLWAVAVVVPAAGFLLSLGNWFFVRLYPSKIAFSNASLLAVLLMLLGGLLWALLHYHGILNSLFSGSAQAVVPLIVACVLIPGLCVAAKLFSLRFACLLGKD